MTSAKLPRTVPAELLTRPAAPVLRDSREPSLARLLDAHVPADAREAAHVQAMRDLLTTPRPFSRDQFDPGHFTASAFVVAPRAELVLLVEHPTLGLWLQPGGHIEPADDSPESAARREVEEETGFAEVQFEPGLFDADVHAIPARGPARAHRHFDLRFLARADAQAQPSSAEGIRAQWVPIDQLDRWTTDESVRRMARKLGGR